jgi:hypothetical protein
MRSVRRVRPVICVLLVVSTMIGAAVPARACGCTASARPTHSQPAPQAAATPAPKSCCKAGGAKKSCCNRSGSTAKASCCEQPHPATASDSAPPVAPGCDCLHCDCRSSEAPPATPAPAPVTPDVGDLLSQTAAFAPVFVPALAAGLPPACPPPIPPPTDLVISLSRLTC